MCDSSGDEHHLLEILQDLVGSIDSTEEPRREKERTCLGELIAQKLEQQDSANREHSR
jgi:hypothetical protein